MTVQPSPQEYTIWSYRAGGVGRRSGIILLVALAIFLGLGATVRSGNPGPLVAVLILIGIPGIIAYFVSEPSFYVVTNRRAMLIKSNKVVQEVSLGTPGLLISTAGAETEVYHHSSRIIVHTKINIIFVANGVELLRFRKVDAGRAEELLAKLKSLGLNVM